MLCSVVKHAGSVRPRKKSRRKHEVQLSVLPYFLSALQLPKCFTAEYRAQSELLNLFYYKESINFHTHSAEFSNQTSFWKRLKVESVYAVL